MSNHPTDLETLLQNDDFVQFVLRPTEESTARWNAWMDGDAERRTLVERCRKIVESVHDSEADVPAAMLAGEIWEKMQGALRPRVRWMPYAAAAAVVLLLAGAGWWLMNGRNAAQTGVAEVKTGVTIDEKGEILAENNGNGLKTVLMVDGSRITLSPGARVHYQSLPGPDARNVRLEGSAFFEVSPDPKRPFTVFAGKVVTRVLGTSFRISGERSITVAVRSGKVSVSHDGTSGAWILLPNEQAVYDAGRNTMAKSVVINKAILENPVPPTPRFSYDESPAPAVIEALAATYAVNIRYDKRLFEKCRITVSLEDGNFYDKLEVLCKVLGAKYDIVNNEVRIAGPGC